ncbi:uncharacterized protein LOC106403866 [Brassica napus]|uniref:uncharacterized protein LOC106403866 n=1 Tax=Brassica napus TaxID=3708 RepID=UPI002078BB65|nr:uncharacterized protein LOC106403866 [Brassica napus]
MEINYPLYKCRLTLRVTKRLVNLNDIQPVHLLSPPNPNSAMAESDTRETNCVYVDTSLDTHLLVLLHDRETISEFKVKLCKEHHECFPELGEIDISAVKVNRENTRGLLFDYHLPDSMLLSMVFNGIGRNCWFLFVDAAVKVENCLNHEEDKNDSLLFEEEDLEVEKTRKKRELELSDGEKSWKKPKVDDLNQSSAAASEFDVDGSHELSGNVQLQLEVVATESSPRKKLDDDTLPETTTSKETEMGEKSVEDDVETHNLVSHQANHLATRSDTEKKRSEDDINQSSAAVIFTTSNVDSVAATPESLPASGGENRGNPFAEATQKEIEKSVEDDTETENHLDTNSRLTARPDAEKKRSEDEANQSSATTAITTSRDIVNEIGKFPGNVPESLPISRGENLDDSFAEATQKENELVQISSIDDVGRDQTETDNLVRHTTNHLDTVSEVTTRPDREKKKRRKKRSKDAISQSFSAASITTSRDIVNEIKGVPAANVDSVDATPESLPIENLGIPSSTEASQKGNFNFISSTHNVILDSWLKTETIYDTLGCGKAIPSAADNIQASNAEADADEAKSVKSNTKTKKSKTPAEEEDTLVVSSDAHNVDESVKAVEGEEPDSIIRNETEENNASLEVADSQELSVDDVNNAALEVADSQEFSVEVNNAAPEETPLIKDAESDASLLRKCADDAVDKSLSKKSLTDDMGDNFGCSQNQEKPDQVAGGAKSKKEKKGLDLHPSGSSNGSLGSMKPKEKRGRAQQPASSSTDPLQSRVPNDASDVTFMSRKLR